MITANVRASSLPWAQDVLREHAESWEIIGRSGLHISITFYASTDAFWDIIADINDDIEIISITTVTAASA